MRVEVLNGASLLASGTAGFDITAGPVVIAIPAAAPAGLIILIGLLGTVASYCLSRVRAGKR